MPSPMWPPGAMSAGCLNADKAPGRMGRCFRAARQRGMFAEAGRPLELDVHQSSRDKERIRRVRAEIAEQHEPIMELLSECALRFNGIPADIAAELTESACLPFEEQPAARRAARDRMLRLLASSVDPCAPSKAFDAGRAASACSAALRGKLGRTGRGLHEQ